MSENPAEPQPEPGDAGKPYRADPDFKPSGDPEVDWFRTVYRGNQRQFTLRSFIMGSLIGAVMGASNLYVGLKTGWGLGVAITACILSFATYSTLSRILPAVFGKNLTMLENNSMQSTASSAASTTSVILASAISALLLVRGHHLPIFVLMGWLFFMAVLGTVMAIPMKRQMVNIEQLRFPSGTAAAETLKSLYGAGAEALAKARSLFAMMGLGALVGWLRDAQAAPGHYILRVFTALSVLPDKIAIPFWKLKRLPLMQYTLSADASLILVAAGMLIGLRTTTSMVIGAILNYGVLAPAALDNSCFVPPPGARIPPSLHPGDAWCAIQTHLDGHGQETLGYRAIVSFTLWPGAAMMVTSGLLAFAFQWRTILRALGGFTKMFSKKKDERTENELELVRAEMDKIEVPSSWFVIGTLFSTVGLVVIGWLTFDIRPWMGVLAVMLSFVLAIVACRATGETDITPIGAMGKITQLTYGILAPAKIITNLMTASITAGSAAASADLLNDLKSGYLLGANPRQQFLAQLSGTIVGTGFVVPLFYLIVPTPEKLGTEQFPAPSAQVWKGVAQVLANGVESLHPWARWGMLIGGGIGIVLPLLELGLPKYKKWLPSATGLGLALVIPGFNSISMFLGALIAYAWTKADKGHAERYVTPVASGLIAGESLIGVVIALGNAGGWLQ